MAENQVSTTKDVTLVNYYPTPASIIPDPLPPSTDILPWEKKAEKERQKEESKRKQQLQQSQNQKKKTLFTTIGNAVSAVATAAVDAVQMVTDEFTDNQSPSAVARFHRFFPGFIQETVLGEYPTKFVISPTSVMYGRLYITSTFFCFIGEQSTCYCLFMMALKSIVSIQKCITTRPPAGTPSQYPPQFNIVPGGNLPAHDPNDINIKYPKMDGLVIFTSDNYQHMFFSMKHFSELYNVLDHAWRDPNPVYQPPPSNSQPQSQPQPQVQQIIAPQQQQIYSTQNQMPNPNPQMSILQQQQQMYASHSQYQNNPNQQQQMMMMQHQQQSNNNNHMAEQVQYPQVVSPIVEFPAVPYHSVSNPGNDYSFMPQNNPQMNQMMYSGGQPNPQFPSVPQHYVPQN